MVLHKFDMKLMEVTKSLKVPLLLNKRYVDDVNAASKVLDRRTRVRVREGRPSLDQVEEETTLENDAHTAYIYRDIANTILPRLVVMEEDVPCQETAHF